MKNMLPKEDFIMKNILDKIDKKKKENKSILKKSK